MAEIFLAKRISGLGAEIQMAIKRILPSFTENDTFGEMLIAEAKLCANLSHANVVYTYDLGKTDGRYYIAMEYVEGLDLNKLLGLLAKVKNSLPLQFALYIIMEALRGLDYAHRLKDEKGALLGIVHRDVSPTNILISTEGEVKLCDFGIARIALSDEGASRIDEYHLQGKIAYMSPEHLNGEVIDSRADIYASGILLWELLSGRRMFKSKDEEDTLRRAKAAEITPLVDRGFPNFRMLNNITMKALSRKPADRFQTCGDFIGEIRDYMQVSGYMVSQLKFSEFLMENFGKRLLEQRRERERSLQTLEEYKKTITIDAPNDHQEPDKPKPENERNAEALIATFSIPPDEISSEGEQSQKVFLNKKEEIEKPKKVVDIALDKEDVNSFIEPLVPAPRKEVSRNFHSAAWVMLGMLAAMAAVATVLYFYLT